jgi:hypothetical protein
MLTDMNINRKLTKAEAERLLSTGQWDLTTDFNKILRNTNVWFNQQEDKVLTKGIVGGRTYFRIYDTIAAFQELIERSKQEPQHVLTGLLPYQEDFPAHIDEMVRGLAEVLKVPVEALDYTSSSLGRLDPKIRRRGREACLNSPAIFAGLVAYSMEIARRRHNWRWVMLKSELHDIWEPWLADDQGWYYSNWITLYTTFAETEYGLSIAGLAGIPSMQRRRAPAE